MKRVGNLFEKLISDENLGKAIDTVNRTHRWRPGHKPNPCTAWVEETKPDRIRDLREMLTNGYVQSKPKIKERYDASAQKTRLISEPIQWPDQYVHHALIQVLQPVMMRGMDRFCCGSIKKRGPHYAKRYIEKWLEKDRKGTRYQSSGDIRHFYDSLKTEIVMDRLRHLVKDRRVLDLVYAVIKDGVRIGAYTSQWFANTTLQPLDNMIRQSGLCSHYVRYMDNLTVFGSNKRKLRKLKGMIAEWLTKHSLELKGDWQIFPLAKETPKAPLDPPRNGFTRPRARITDAVGYRFGRDFSIPRKHNLIRMKRGVARYRKRRGKGQAIRPRSASGLLSRLGQLVHCNNYNLYRRLFQGKRIIHSLKEIVRAAHKEEELTWSMYLEQRKEWRRSKQKGLLTAT